MILSDGIVLYRIAFVLRQCVTTSLVLSLARLSGKKNNKIYHFVWFVGLLMFKQMDVTYKKAIKHSIYLDI